MKMNKVNKNKNKREEVSLEKKMGGRAMVAQP